MKVRTRLSLIGWPLLLIAAARVLFAFRSDIASEHVVLVFLLVVLGASAGGGRLLGVTLSFAAFFIFDWWFIPPYNTLVVRNPLDWLALIAFLATSLVAAQLLYSARRERAAVERAEALREADRLKDALLATVSHDLRTPLTSIKGLASEMIETGAVDDRALIIAEEADRLNRMVGNLLDVARLNAGELKLDVQVNALDDLVGAAVQQFSGRHDRNRIVASLDHADEVLAGRFDFVQSLRIVTNLIENALKYSPPDTTVRIRGGVTDSMLMIRVSDEGPGIPAEAREKIFDAFARIGDPRPDAGSAGLGLSIGRQLADIQGGRLILEEPAGPGSAFVLFLPAVDSDEL
jgi:two-component system, OmpR family, sensor histidine kinase KdpD